jgi:Domain of Unknown Function (DUF1080)
MPPAPRFILTLSLGLLQCLVQAADAVAPTAKLELFNGKDLSGWVSHLKNDAPADKTWSVKDGSIVCTGAPNGYLRTEKAFKNYKCTVEWRFVKAGNTGVIVHMTLPDAVWPKSIECQGMHKYQGDFYFWSGATAKDSTPLKAKDGTIRGYKIARSAPDAEKPPGEWNTFTTVCDAESVTILVNDQVVNKASGLNLSEGFIGLQAEGAIFEVRRVTLEPLTK